MQSCWSLRFVQDVALHPRMALQSRRAVGMGRCSWRWRKDTTCFQQPHFMILQFGCGKASRAGEGWSSVFKEWKVFLTQASPLPVHQSCLSLKLSWFQCQDATAQGTYRGCSGLCWCLPKAGFIHGFSPMIGLGKSGESNQPVLPYFIL